jgi:hypothetical protein
MPSNDDDLIGIYRYLAWEFRTNGIGSNAFHYLEVLYKKAWNTRAGHLMSKTPWLPREEFEKSGYEGAVWVVTCTYLVESAFYNGDYCGTGDFIYDRFLISHVQPRQEEPEPPEVE